MIAVAWGVSSVKDGQFPWEAIVLFIPSLGTWLFSEFKFNKSPKEKNNLHPHDVDLGQKLRNLFDERSKIFLREHSFGQAYPHSRLHAVRDISYWEGAEYEFINSELDNISAEIVRLSDELYSKLAEYAGPINHPEGFFAVPLDYERAQDRFGPETIERIKELNGISKEIVNYLDKFEKAFRRLSPESYITAEKKPTISTFGGRVIE